MPQHALMHTYKQVHATTPIWNCHWRKTVLHESRFLSLCMPWHHHAQLVDYFILKLLNCYELTPLPVVSTFHPVTIYSMAYLPLKTPLSFLLSSPQSFQNMQYNLQSPISRQVFVHFILHRKQKNTYAHFTEVGLTLKINLWCTVSMSFMKTPLNLGHSSGSTINQKRASSQ